MNIGYRSVHLFHGIPNIEQLPKHRADMWRLTGHLTMGHEFEFFKILSLLDELNKTIYGKSGAWA